VIVPGRGSSVGARRSGSRARDVLRWTLAPLAALLLSAASSGAHAVLVRSAPAARAAVTTAPDRVLLWFNERLEPAYSSASVWNASGAQVDRKDARVEPDDPKRLALTVGALAPGAYTVRYRVLSVDGHVVESSFSFTVRPPAPR
jgi:methionine-rich copper-binding protein CopC